MRLSTFSALRRDPEQIILRNITTLDAETCQAVHGGTVHILYSTLTPCRVGSMPGPELNQLINQIIYETCHGQSHVFVAYGKGEDAKCGSVQTQGIIGL